MRSVIPIVATILLAAAATTPTVAVAAPNDEPLAEAGLDQTVSRGDTVLLDAGGSSDPDGDVTEYRWDITAPDGSTVPPTCRPCERTTFPADQTGIYEVTLTVTDDDGATSTDTMYVTVEGTEGPAVTLAGPGQTTSGERARYDATVDAGDAKLDRVVWRVDGTVVQRSGAAGRHAEPLLRRTFDATGQHIVSVTVVDEDDRRATDTVAVSVGPTGQPSGGGSFWSGGTNEPPSVSLRGPDVVDPGSVVDFQAVANDSDGVVIEYEWSNAIRATPTRGSTASHYFTEGEGETVVIGVTVRDDDGETATANKTVRIRDTPDPQVNITQTPSASPVEACSPTDVDLEANVEHFDASIDSYSWSGVDTTNWKWSSVSVDGNEQSQYRVEVTVESVRGETATDSIKFRTECEAGESNSPKTDVIISSLNALTQPMGNDVDSSFAQVDGTSHLPASTDSIKLELTGEAAGVEEVTVVFRSGTGKTNVRTVPLQPDGSIGASVTFSYDVEEMMPVNARTNILSRTALISVKNGNETLDTASRTLTWTNEVRSTGQFSVLLRPQGESAPTNDEPEAVGITEGRELQIDLVTTSGYDGKVEVTYGDGSTETVSMREEATWNADEATVRVTHTYTDTGTKTMSAVPQERNLDGTGDSFEVVVAGDGTEGPERSASEVGGNGSTDRQQRSEASSERSASDPFGQNHVTDAAVSTSPRNQQSKRVSSGNTRENDQRQSEETPGGSGNVGGHNGVGGRQTDTDTTGGLPRTSESTTETTGSQFGGPPSSGTDDNGNTSSSGEGSHSGRGDNHWIAV